MIYNSTSPGQLYTYYGYDNNGLITQMNIGDNVSNYTYDSLGRIASETNNGTSKSYTYNTNGLLYIVKC